jgi:hypothetical protein
MNISWHSPANAGISAHPVIRNARGRVRGAALHGCVKKKVPHRHFVFSIPKILRRYFLYNRKLLADLSRCAWDSLKVFLYPEGHKQEAVHENNLLASFGLDRGGGDELKYPQRVGRLCSSCAKTKWRFFLYFERAVLR